MYNKFIGSDCSLALSVYKTNGMRKNLLIIFILLSVSSYSQKKYDCIVITKYTGDSLNEHRFVGYMRIITDSSILLISKKGDSIFNWRDLQAVKFRKHNGFMRTVFPLAVMASFCLSEIEANALVTANYLKPELKLFLTIGYSIFIIPTSTIVYFITRNHKYSIDSYPDFLKLKRAASKYIFKP